MKAKERHDIKTDKFLEFVTRAEDFIVDNAKKIGLIVLSAVVILALWLGGMWFMDSREQAGANDLNELLASFTAAQVASALNDELLAEFDTEFTAVVDSHGGTAAAIIARYYLGIVKGIQGDEEAAVEQFRTVLDSRHTLFWTLAAKELGDILLGQEKPADAAEIFARVADSGDRNGPGAFYAFRAGESYELAGDKNNALLYYNKAKESETLGLDAALLNRIERKIQSLTEVE